MEKNDSESTPANVTAQAPARTELPVMTLRTAVLLPYVGLAVVARRTHSALAIKAALESEDRAIAIFAQRDPTTETPEPEHLYTVGTRAVIQRVAVSDDGPKVVLFGLGRLSLEEVVQTSPFLQAEVGDLPFVAGDATELEAHQRDALDLANRLQKIVRPTQLVNLEQIAAEVESPMHLVYVIASALTLSVERAQLLLQIDSQTDALRMLVRYLSHELNVAELQNQISSRASATIDQRQREYLLRQQMHAIRDELGEGDGGELEELRQALSEAELPELVRSESERTLERMARLPAESAEYNVSRDHLSVILELPWNESTEDNLDLAHARQVLDADHFGLEEVKERVLEHLAVLRLNPEAQAPILCFVGPPGVGKTSLGASIARALGRRFERLSLGGMHDEAELRGHRRTYVGAIPGRILQAIRRAGANNPLLMLDEVDKIGHHFRGDAAAALLEILDPAQNSDFRDNYLDLPFDLSKVFFITTANALDTVPRPLLDRMETVALGGYSEEEKIEIARRYLFPRRWREAGLDEDQLELSDEVLRGIIRGYTGEAGVRQLERALGSLARKIALKVAEGGSRPAAIEPEELGELLGPPPRLHEGLRKQLPVGVATGLAWTEAGGDVLYVEAVRLAAGDDLTLTGQLGEVMKESVLAARSYVLSRRRALGAQATEGSVHVHVPAGAIPKDGPSAGITMAVALASLYSEVPVRSDTAMTGEITLSGLVLPVGGIREKVLAAHRAGLRRVILPRGNEQDLARLPATIREQMDLVLAETVAEVLEAVISGLAPEPLDN